MKLFIEDANILPLSPDVVTQSVKIRRSRKIKTPDALIAATAIISDFYTSYNDSDFKNIPGLKIIDPHKM